MTLKGKSVVITGAGRGIGREIALLMAKQGARVVVNDYGGSSAGLGGEKTPADEVVNDIRKGGGEAVANYDSVATMAGGAAIVKTALDAYGRVDVVVNKARVEKVKRMGPQHIAPVAVFLASDAAKEVTGQVFGVRGKEIMLFGHERPVMRVHNDEGWTPEKIADIFPGTLQHHLVPLVTSGQYFNYDPLV